MVVEGAESKGHVESVMHGVEMTIEEFRGMKCAMEKVLPCIDDEAVRWSADWYEGLIARHRGTHKAK